MYICTYVLYIVVVVRDCEIGDCRIGDRRCRNVSEISSKSHILSPEFFLLCV